MQKYFQDTVDTICEMISYDSSLSESEEGAPFGKGAADCLTRFLAIAEGFGFKTKNYDNYVGEVIFGEGKPFAILAHLDVVPAGEGWTHSPFKAEISDGKIWGRGATDDKGPAVSCLYCLKALKDEGFKPNREIHLILGCNEETGWKCIEHYNECAAMPEEGFSPDADFPVIYAEKGIAHIDAFFKLKNPPFKSLSAGTRANVVCEYVTAEIKEEYLSVLKNMPVPLKGASVEFDGDIMRVKGKSAHGAFPSLGINALECAVRMFAEVDKELEKVRDFLFDDVANLKAMRDETGYLTMSPDIASFSDGVLKITTDFRYPSTHSIDELLSAFKKFGVEYEIANHQRPLFNDKTSSMITTLAEVYKEKTGKQATPIAIGGGTYARALKYGCAFGPEEEGENNAIHQADESITLKKVALMNEIYYEAIKRLTK